MPVDASIPLRVETPKFITPADLLSLKDLQTRARMNEFNLEQAPENARMDRELKQSEIDYRRQMSLGQIGKQKKDQEAADYEEAVRHASALVSATPQQRAGIWKFIRQWSVSKDPQNEAKLPQEWDESLLPKFQALAFGALKPEQAIERADYSQGTPMQPQGPQPPQVPLQNIDQQSGAIVSPMPQQAAPVGVPLADIGNGLPPQEAAFQTQLETTGQATAPPVEVDEKKIKTPDDWRAYADAQDARGTKASFERAKEARVEANRLEQRITDQEKLEDARAGRGEAAKSREQAQQFKNIDVENKLRDDFLKGSKVFVDTKDAYTRIQDSASDPSAAGDLALIFNYMKMLDPGSTVREGEFATAQDSAGVPERVRNYYNRLLSGERLGEEQRKDFVGRADKLYQGILRNHEGLEKQYRTIATKAKVDPQSVIVDLRPAKRPGAGPKKEAAKAPSGVDQKLWDAMTPEEKKLWQN